MRVLKFGGTSVATSENINKVLQIVENARLEYKQQLVVIVSALGGTTDALIRSAEDASLGKASYSDILTQIETRHLQCVRELLPPATQSGTLSLVKKKCNDLERILESIFLLRELTSRALDSIMGYGELISSLILSACFHSHAVSHRWIDSRILICTNSDYGNAAVDFATSCTQINAVFESDPQPLYVLPGFIASDSSGIPTTLGRGGSDYSAAILAAALGAEVLEIWTDVNGMMSADPRIVPQAKTIPRLSYQEAMELSHFGAKVIFPPTIQPVMDKGIPVRIRNTFEPEQEGSLIGKEISLGNSLVCGLSTLDQISLISLQGSGMVGIPGISRRLFESLSSERINVIFITQCSSEYAITVGLEKKFLRAALKALKTMFAPEIHAGKIENPQAESELSILALVGDRMKNHPGISGKMFHALGRNGVNIRAVAQGSSERNISAVIRTSDLRKACNVLHETFFEPVCKQVNLFIIGLGNVGSRLMEQLLKQEAYLREHLNLQLRIAGIANSRNMLLPSDGVILNTWKNELEQAAPMNLPGFIQTILDRNLRNSVFVDVTADENVAGTYATLLSNNISLVACNKIACSSSYESYQELQWLSSGYNASFHFETNVGAGLPIIGTLSDLVKSGDEIYSIQAVLSGTLNYVFNEYDATVPFAEIVRRAQKEGYTEPDPRKDLNGSDVMRKILILARQCGAQLEMDEVKSAPFLPPSCLKGTVEDFYKELTRQEPHFRKLYTSASSEGCKLKYVATFEKGKTCAGLQHILPGNNLFHLYGKDNVVVVHTRRYPDQPLVIKGAGAGAEVTASGIFADIIRTARGFSG
jgi:aspartokinase/homoserine dehydrogenase 1